MGRWPIHANLSLKHLGVHAVVFHKLIVASFLDKAAALKY